jgi:hypothetical protein
MEEFQSPVEISKRLANEYKVDAQRAETSISKLIEELKKEGLIISIKGGD